MESAAVAGEHARALHAVISQPAGAMIPGVNSWVIDTGSGHHLASRKTLSKQEAETLRCGEMLKLATANGVISGTEVADSPITALGGTDVEVRVLCDTPRVLSVHQLVQEGCTFVWDEDGARLLQNGHVHHLTIKGGVPLMAMPTIPDDAS